MFDIIFTIHDAKEQHFSRVYKGFSLKRRGKFPKKMYLCTKMTRNVINKTAWRIKVIVILITYHLSLITSAAQMDSLRYRAELQTTLGTGDYNPLWLNANRYGLSSLKTTNGYLRGTIERPLSLDDGRKWGLGYGADVALASGFTSTLVVQQAYVEGRWLKGTLTVGAKEQPMELKNMELSSGSQALGINARPIPQVRVALPDFWIIPGTKEWMALKGHIAFGKTTDDKWQKDFTSHQSRYTEGTLYHSKAGYLRIGPKNVTVTVGLEMATQFGGKGYLFDNGIKQEVDNESGLSAFMHALFYGGSDKPDGDFKNTEGNQLGSGLLRVDIHQTDWSLGLYADKFFEDYSMMVHMNKSGDGYFAYDFKDWLLGAELQLNRLEWLKGIVLEYLYTKYQSGPVYHDQTPNVPIQISARDNYYNHYLFTGWQHWGQVIGNPLYLSPLYNEDGTIEVKHNRFVAWHLGMNGNPALNWHYRLLASWQKSYGSYYYLPVEPVSNWSLLAEASWCLPKSGWSIKGAVGFDSGDLRGNNFGFQLGIQKTGWLNIKKK